MRKSILLVTAGFLSCLSASAFAQNTNINGNSNDNSNLNYTRTTVSVKSDQRQSQTTTLDGHFGGTGGSVNVQGSPGSYGLPSPASGPCTGVSGGMGFNSMIGGGGFSLGTIDDKCSQRELIRLMLNTNDPTIQAHAKKDLLKMEADEFGTDNGGQQKAELTSSDAVQTAAVDDNRCSNDSWPVAVKLAHHCN